MPGEGRCLVLQCPSVPRPTVAAGAFAPPRAAVGVALTAHLVALHEFVMAIYLAVTAFFVEAAMRCVDHGLHLVCMHLCRLHPCLVICCAIRGRLVIMRARRSPPLTALAPFAAARGALHGLVVSWPTS
eukprot:5976164-Alexandrium_andersonii.AAC.1